MVRLGGSEPSDGGSNPSHDINRVGKLGYSHRAHNPTLVRARRFKSCPCYQKHGIWNFKFRITNKYYKRILLGMPPKKSKADKTVTDLEILDSVVEVPATEIVCVIDRSGSMESIKTDAIGGFNNFLKEQQNEPGEATMTIMLFDDKFEFLCQGKPVKEVEPLSDKTFVPRGSTALLDAIGETITSLNERNPEKAIIMILTDGHENASRIYNKGKIKQMIDACKENKWFVAYLSADAEAFDDAQSVGIGHAQTMSFTPNQQGAHVSMMSCSYAASDYRSAGYKGMSSMAVYGATARNNYRPGINETNHNPLFSSSGSPLGEKSKRKKMGSGGYFR